VKTHQDAKHYATLSVTVIFVLKTKVCFLCGENQELITLQPGCLITG